MSPMLHVMLTRTRTGEPLATVDGLPGGDADLTSAQLRSLAVALTRIADDLDGRPVTKKTPTARREYSVSAATGPADPRD